MIMARKKYIYDFNEGDASMRMLLGGKGANLAQMWKIGLPVPVILLRGALSYIFKVYFMGHFNFKVRQLNLDGDGRLLLDKLYFFAARTIFSI